MNLISDFIREMVGNTLAVQTWEGFIGYMLFWLLFVIGVGWFFTVIVLGSLKFFFKSGLWKVFLYLIFGGFLTFIAVYIWLIVRT